MEIFNSKIPHNLILEDIGMNRKHIAIILKNMKPVSQYKTNFHLSDTDSINSVHAEINAIFSFLRISRRYIRLFNNINKINPNKLKKYYQKCSGLDIFVIRVNKNGHISNSKPCDCCQSVIKKLGFRNVIYSTGNPEDELETFKC